MSSGSSKSGNDVAAAPKTRDFATIKRKPNRKEGVGRVTSNEGVKHTIPMKAPPAIAASKESTGVWARMKAFPKMVGKP